MTNMVVTKLFRDPMDAAKALGQLKAKGYTEKEVSLLALNKGGAAKLLTGKVVNLSKGESAIASGPVVATLTGEGEDLEAKLVKALETTEEKADYYRFSLGAGSALVSVHTGEGQAKQVRDILNKAESIPQPKPAKESTPGFVAASRMSTTNPIDAPMSGDFRRY